VKDELGNPVTGATAQVRLPGNDGTLSYKADVSLTYIDGKHDPDLAFMKKGTKDGDVEIPADKMKGNIKQDETFEVLVNAPGFVEWSKSFKYRENEPNIIETSSKFILKIVFVDGADKEAEKKVPGMTAVINDELEIKDGSDMDADKVENGVIFCEFITDKDVEISVSYKSGEKKAGDRVVNVSNKKQTLILFIVEGSEAR
jgi:hypothetical protein